MLKDQIHIYYRYTLALALGLAFLYYLRLRHRFNVLIIYSCALMIYYALGLAGLLTAGTASPMKLIFRGYFLLLPGDIFSLVISVYLIYPLALKMRDQYPDYYAQSG